jgi:hypothetical protein
LQRLEMGRVDRRGIGKILDLGRRQKVCEQKESLLFGLPAELRLRIYEEYFGVGKEVVLGFKNGRLSGRVERGDKSEAYGKVDMLPLLRTCRKM